MAKGFLVMGVRGWGIVMEWYWGKYGVSVVIGGKFEEEIVLLRATCSLSYGIEKGC